MGGYENTSRLPDLETLKKIAQLFDISLDYVAGYTDVPYTLKKRREISDEEMRFMSVYRQLNALAEAGEADTVRLEGQQLFRLCGDDGHHHHLVCTNCGKTVEIESPSETWLRGISEKYGFTIERHTLEVFGLCPDCRNEARR